MISAAQITAILDRELSRREEFGSPGTYVLTSSDVGDIASSIARAVQATADEAVTAAPPLAPLDRLRAALRDDLKKP